MRREGVFLISISERWQPYTPPGINLVPLSLALCPFYITPVGIDGFLWLSYLSSQISSVEVEFVFCTRRQCEILKTNAKSVKAQKQNLNLIGTYGQFHKSEYTYIIFFWQLIYKQRHCLKILKSSELFKDDEASQCVVDLSCSDRGP